MKQKIIPVMAIVSVLSLAGHLQADSLQYVITQEGTLNVRGQGSTKGPVLFQLKRGERVHVMEEGTGDEDHWSRIKTDDGRTGFVLTQYLANFTPAELDRSAFLAIAAGGEGKKVMLLPLGIRTQGTWHSGNFNYLAMRLSKQNQSMLLLGPGNKTGSLRITGIARAGCQEHEVPEGLATGEAIPSGDEMSQAFAASGFTDLSRVTLRVIDETDSLTGRLKEQAALLLKKEGFEGAVTELQGDGVFAFSSAGNPASTFYSARFVVRTQKDGATIEKFYAYVLADGNLRLMHTSAEGLGDEQGMYGGSYHLIGALKERGSDSILLVFFHVGYDGGVYELFELKGKQFKKLNQGYGDAC